MRGLPGHPGRPTLPGHPGQAEEPTSTCQKQAGLPGYPGQPTVPGNPGRVEVVGGGGERDLIVDRSSRRGFRHALFVVVCMLRRQTLMVCASVMPAPVLLSATGMVVPCCSML